MLVISSCPCTFISSLSPTTVLSSQPGGKDERVCHAVRRVMVTLLPQHPWAQALDVLPTLWTVSSNLQVARMPLVWESGGPGSWSPPCSPSGYGSCPSHFFSLTLSFPICKMKVTPTLSRCCHPLRIKWRAHMACLSSNVLTFVDWNQHDCFI